MKSFSEVNEDFLVIKFFSEEKLEDPPEMIISSKYCTVHLMRLGNNIKKYAHPSLGFIQTPHR